MSHLLEVCNLRKHYQRGGGILTASGKGERFAAVDDISFFVAAGETFAIVGESGCGKTTLARILLRLIEPDEGKVLFEGTDLLGLSPKDMRTYRRQMQMIFQDPFASLNPRMKVGEIVAEPLAIHEPQLPRTESLAKAGEILQRVGLGEDALPRYPHEFSGGQRQRVGVARALATGPDLIVADEPVSALDVSIQAQVLNLLGDLQAEMGLAYLFIAHNLAVVEHFADEVAVMYLGKIVEQASRDALYARPTHPYTRALLSAVPQPVPGRPKQTIRLAGEVPSPINPPPGCAFHPRCPLTRQLAEDTDAGRTVTILSEGEPVRILARCMTEQPRLLPIPDDPTHCHACMIQQ